MKILVIDTTGAAASVSVINEKKEIVSELSGDIMSHLRKLMPMTEVVLKKSGTEKSELTHVAAAVGPGSFTGCLLYTSTGDYVIVETARGLEYGEIATPNGEVSKKSVVQPLKKVLRAADEQDALRHGENLRKKQSALEICQKKIDARGLEMKLIDVEYTFDNTKVIFYFTADGRVDFRELVKDLASVFKMRIELRQIGVRDEAKMLGGIGTCGRGLCCHTWLPDFEPVSIKMAKTQGLSLNPAKISGICGRLMCCLKYENEAYGMLKAGLPENGERVRTPDGPGIVVDTKVLRGQVKVRLFLDESRENTSDEEKLSSDVTLSLIHISPIAPVNNSAYRSFTSGIIVPSDKTIEILPVKDEDRFVVVIEDGRIVARDDVRKVTVRVAERKAKIVRFSSYNFWSKVKDKIL